MDIVSFSLDSAGQSSDPVWFGNPWKWMNERTNPNITLTHRLVESSLLVITILACVYRFTLLHDFICTISLYLVSFTQLSCFSMMPGFAKFLRVCLMRMDLFSCSEACRWVWEMSTQKLKQMHQCLSQQTVQEPALKKKKKKKKGIAAQSRKNRLLYGSGKSCEVYQSNCCNPLLTDKSYCYVLNAYWLFSEVKLM